MKVPFRKAIAYEQKIVRTMVFERTEVFKCNGKAFNVSNESNVSTFNSKMHTVTIFNECLNREVVDKLTAKTFSSFRDNTIMKLKEWD